MVLPAPELLLTLEQQLRLDYVVLPKDWPGVPDFQRLPDYQVVNDDDPGAEVHVYRRVVP